MRGNGMRFEVLYGASINLKQWVLGLLIGMVGVLGIPKDGLSNDRHVILISLDGLAAFLMDDPNASLPTLRKIAKEGAFMEAGMIVSNPAVTWPNHTTLITGVRPAKHGVLANGVLLRSGPGVPVRIQSDKSHADMVRVRSVADLAHEQGLKTGEINWPCTRQNASFHDSFPDVPDALSYTTPRLIEELMALELLTERNGKPAFGIGSPVGRDWVWTQAACHLIKERKPNLLLVHLLNVDTTHHKFGAQTQAGYSSNSYIDLCLREIIDATKEAGIFERTTFIVVSDHGFMTTPKTLRPNVLLRKSGLLKVDGNRVVEARINVVPEGGIGLVYCTNPLEGRDLQGTIRDVFEGQEGVAEVIFPNRFEELGFPLPREYDQAPDAIIAAKDGYSISAPADPENAVEASEVAGTALGTHGFLASDKRMNGICILWGAGIKPGVKLSTVENTAIAPTIAELLSIQGLESDSKPLMDALLIPNTASPQ